MRAYLSRWVCRDVEANFNALERDCARAAEQEADLVVFPESFLHGYTRTADPARIREAFARLSRRRPDTTYVFGSFSERKRNRMTVWIDGKERGRYDKVHLFEPNGENDLWEPGDRYVAVRAAGLTLGLVNCNDLRFPEQARALRLQAGCDALVAVAWWPWRRNHVWRTLLRARALENGAWTLGCCVAASEYPDETFAGAGNYVFDPLGDPVATEDDTTYVLDRERERDFVVDPVSGYRPIDRVHVFTGEESTG